MKTKETKPRYIDYLIVTQMAENGMNVAKTARRVFMSTSGCNARIRMIKKFTGLDPRNFYDLIKLLKICEQWK